MSSSLLSFDSLFGQPSDPGPRKTASECCRYERAFREAESSLVECSSRYGGGSDTTSTGGVGGDVGGVDVTIEPFDTPIPRDTVPRRRKKEPPMRSGSSWSDCYAPSASALMEDDDDDDDDRRQDAGSSEQQDGGGGKGEEEDGEHLYIHAIRATRCSRRGRGGREEEGDASQNPQRRRPEQRAQAQTPSQAQAASQAQAPAKAPPLILLHGYANGCMYFYRNLRGLAARGCPHLFSAVYSVDMLGWGLSSRPEFVTADDSVASAEDFFVNSLEAWRVANGIEKMILGGHSLGGYVAVAYAERFPENIDKLLLLSPVGVQDVPADPVAGPEVPLGHKMVYGFFRAFWRNGWTPGAVIRSVYEWKGRLGVARYVDNRLPGVKCPQERNALIGYLYHNAVLPPSGEGCLNRLLRPGAYAIDPLVHRIPNLKVVEVAFVYGEKDWMDPTAGLEVERVCREERRRRRIGEGGGGDGGALSSPPPPPPRVAVHAVRNAGHLLMIENWEGFNAAVVLACGGTLPEDERHRPGTFVDRTRQRATTMATTAVATAAPSSSHPPPGGDDGAALSLGRQKTDVSTVESEVTCTEELSSSQESVEIDMNRSRVVISCE